MIQLINSPCGCFLTLRLCLSSFLLIDVANDTITLSLQSFKELTQQPVIVHLTVEESARLKVLYGSAVGFHAIDLDSASIYDIYVPQNVGVACEFHLRIQLHSGQITPHCIVILPNSNGMQLLLSYDSEGVFVNTYGKLTKNITMQWGEMPSSVGR